ncbi:unnamed protein product [Caenorhabditis bovis]|uniref:Protein kinase domain-containing protein n=1 Tax=Caenorhabditis bovis TaxID=2654633 RepID=A0A8S1ECT3_9PELO|nr:unnamed protein product [Caenorhabditis bovis]
MSHEPICDPNQSQNQTVRAFQGTGSQGGRDFEITLMDKKLIGNGSFGMVYRACLAENGTMVAVKTAFQDRRFKCREVNVMKDLDHPNIVRLYYYFMTEENQGSDVISCVNLVLELMPQDLHNFQKQYAIKRTIMPQLLIRLFSYQLLRGLGFLHMNNIVHRDIKPQNLLVDAKKGLLKICDFGSAKFINYNEPSVSYICSRYYRAPEVLMGSTKYGSAIDCWSAGCVIGEMMSFKPLFIGDSGTDVLTKIIKVLGTPTDEDIASMQIDNHVSYLMNKSEGEGLQSIIHVQMKKDVMQLVTSLLHFNVYSRIHPMAALHMDYFNSIRAETIRVMKNSAILDEIPPLTDFLQDEYLFLQNTISYQNHMH